MSLNQYYSGTLTLPSDVTFAFTAQIGGTATVTIASSPNGPVFGQGTVQANGPTVFLNTSGEFLYAANMTFSNGANTLNYAVEQNGNVMAQGVLASWMG
jgi:hypothetical protein